MDTGTQGHFDILTFSREKGQEGSVRMGSSFESMLCSRQSFATVFCWRLWANPNLPPIKEPLRKHGPDTVPETQSCFSPSVPVRHHMRHSWRNVYKINAGHVLLWSSATFHSNKIVHSGRPCFKAMFSEICSTAQKSETALSFIYFPAKTAWSLNGCQIVF